MRRSNRSRCAFRPRRWVARIGHAGAELAGEFQLSLCFDLAPAMDRTNDQSSRVQREGPPCEICNRNFRLELNNDLGRTADCKPKIAISAAAIDRNFRKPVRILVPEGCAGRAIAEGPR